MFQGFVYVLTSRWQQRTSRWMPATLKTQEEDDVGGDVWCTQYQHLSGCLFDKPFLDFMFWKGWTPGLPCPETGFYNQTTNICTSVNTVNNERFYLDHY